MGWTFSERWHDRAELVQHLRSDWAEGVKCLGDSVVGNHYWAALETTRRDGTQQRFVFLALMKGGTRKTPGWGYKEMDESAGPLFYDCPLKLLALAAPAPADEYAVEWRKSVVLYHRKKRHNARLKRTVKAGLRCGLPVIIGTTRYIYNGTAAYKRSQLSVIAPNGIAYRCPFSRIDCKATLALWAGIPKTDLWPEPDETTTADFFRQRMADGDISADDLPVRIARQGLMSPEAFHEEVR